LKISNTSRFNTASEEQDARKRLEARCKLLEERLATKTHELEQAIDKIPGLRSREIELKEKHGMANAFHKENRATLRNYGAILQMPGRQRTSLRLSSSARKFTRIPFYRKTSRR
jgi:hypothetical protein